MQILMINREGLALLRAACIIYRAPGVSVSPLKEGAFKNQTAAFPALKAISIACLLFFLDIFLIKCT